jgi:hypothetical protein
MQESAKRSIAHSMAITRTASTRTKKEHKTSFRVPSVAGAEDFAVQVIENKSTTQAMRVDYYKLLRKWRVDLIRYGLRMTYDIVIPQSRLEFDRKGDGIARPEPNECKRQHVQPDLTTINETRRRK